MPADRSAVSGWRRYYIPAQRRWSDALAIELLQIFTLLFDVTLPSRTIGPDGEAINHFRTDLQVKVACILPDIVTVEGIKNITTPLMRQCCCVGSRENLMVERLRSLRVTYNSQVAATPRV